MSSRTTGIRRRVLVTATAAALALSLPLAGLTSASTGSGGLKPNVVSVKPTYTRALKAADSVRFTCQDVRAGHPLCYNPQQIRTAYQVTPLLNAGINGKHRTIVIVDAFSNPYAWGDIQAFDKTFGIPDPIFNQIAPQGVPAFNIHDADQLGWTVESDLDIQWSHAIAPKANIVLIDAKSDQDIDIYNATKWAVDHNIGDVISQSFGEAESCVDPKIDKLQHAMFAKAVAKGITLFASAGDDGSAQLNCAGSTYIKSASSPANDPLVTSVGGTNLVANTKTGAYGSEVAWNDAYSECGPDATYGCGGGGYSNIYARPAYQQGVANASATKRSIPDVSYNAGVDGGVLVHLGAINIADFGLAPTDPSIFFIVGGTSAGSPQWAGLAALADQLAGHRLGNINPTLYQIGKTAGLHAAAYHDITVGSNRFGFLDASNNPVTIPGFSAKIRWDAATGWGTPKANVLVPLLAALSH
jgi:subtilase family serine protease